MKKENLIVCIENLLFACGYIISKNNNHLYQNLIFKRKKDNILFELSVGDGGYYYNALILTCTMTVKSNSKYFEENIKRYNIIFEKEILSTFKEIGKGRENMVSQEPYFWEHYKEYEEFECSMKHIVFY